MFCFMFVVHLLTCIVYMFYSFCLSCVCCLCRLALLICLTVSVSCVYVIVFLVFVDHAWFLSCIVSVFVFVCGAVVLQSSVREEKKLLVENAKLKKDIDGLKKFLQDTQKRKSGTLKHTQMYVHTHSLTHSDTHTLTHTL